MDSHQFIAASGLVGGPQGLTNSELQASLRFFCSEVLALCSKTKYANKHYMSFRGQFES